MKEHFVTESKEEKKKRQNKKCLLNAYTRLDMPCNQQLMQQKLEKHEETSTLRNITDCLRKTCLNNSTC